MYHRRHTKNVILTVLIILSFVMIIGYSALSSRLVINGTSNITSNFRILFTDIQEGTMNSAETKEKSFEGTTATFKVDLKKPGSSAEYILTVENQGSLDAYLESIEGIDEANASSPTYIKFKLKGITRYTRLSVGDTKTFKVIVTYDESATEIPTNSKQLTLTLNFAQVSGSIPEPEPEPLGNAAEYLAFDKVQSTVADGGNGLVAIDNNGEITTSTSPREYRYIGPNPDNYVQFNNELWRIIGVFDGRLKIMRKDSLGDLFWNSDAINDWTQSSLQKLLNSGDYYNRTGTYSTNGLTTESKQLIDTVLWNLGGSNSNQDVSPKMFYDRERGTTVYSNHATEWLGQVGLIYPSDYGFSTSGGTTASRSSCINKALYYWDSTNFLVCSQNSWIKVSRSIWIWTLTPSSLKENYSYFIGMYGTMGINFSTSYVNKISIDSFPTLYLKRDVDIMSGSGTEKDPYILR